MSKRVIYKCSNCGRETEEYNIEGSRDEMWYHLDTHMIKGTFYGDSFPGRGALAGDFCSQPCLVEGIHKLIEENSPIKVVVITGNEDADPASTP